MKDDATNKIPALLRNTGDFHWDLAPDVDYKPPADHFRGVRRVNLAGMRGEKTKFHVRYFEIEPGGFTTRETHQHEHIVVVLRGEGEALTGDQWQRVGFGDVLYVAPGLVHQLRNPGEQPFGFLCMVDAERDSPQPVQD